MKSLSILVAALCLNSYAQAESPSSACGKFIECGAYQATQKLDDGRTVVREISFAEFEPNKIQLEFATIDGSERKVMSSMKLVFQPDGSFAYAQAETRATGICKHSACTMSVRPREFDGETVSQAAVFQFSADALYFSKFWVDSKGKHSSRERMQRVGAPASAKSEVPQAELLSQVSQVSEIKKRPGACVVFFPLAGSICVAASSERECYRKAKGIAGAFATAIWSPRGRC